MPRELPADPGALGAYVRAQRLRVGITQGQLAAAIGVNKSYIARIEAGERLRPAADLLQHIADALAIDAAELLAFLGVRPSLPEPQVYFRRKYGMNAKQANVLARLVEEYQAQGKEETGYDNE